MLLQPKNIPQTPGVYFFKDPAGKYLYIGKAANLKSRLSSYFNKQPKEPRILKMLEEAKMLDWQETGSEIEALILESQLIKKHRPKFNILMRDDKQYFYVIFTKEEFPRLFPTHQPFAYAQNKNLKPITYNLKPVFIGPFTDGKALKTTLKLLRRVFPYCTCKKPHYNYCLNYHLGNCPGFCCLKKSGLRIMNLELRKYKKNINAIKDILLGKKLILAKRLEKEMLTQAQNHDFENAIKIRKQLAGLRKVFENARIIQNKSYDIMIYHRIGYSGVLKSLRKGFKLPALPRRIEGYDISNIQGRMATGSMVVFENGQPDKSQYRKFKIKADGKADDAKMLKEILDRRLKHKDWTYPDLIIVDGGKGQFNAAALVLKSSGLATPILALTKNNRHRGSHIFTNGKESISLDRLPPAVKNLILSVDAEAHRFAISYYRQLHRKKIL